MAMKNFGAKNAVCITGEGRCAGLNSTFSIPGRCPGLSISDPFRVNPDYNLYLNEKPEGLKYQ